MNPLIFHREKLNITQKELAEQSGVSVRTIQRIEAGEAPKGYTLRVLAKALNITEAELLEKKTEILPNTQLLKYINLSSLLFVFLPPLNIIVPLLLMYHKNEFTTTAKKIIDLQIFWLLISALLVVLSSFVKRFFGDDNAITLVIICMIIIVDLYIILRNARELDTKENLFIKLNFSIL
ncbi:MAG: helix-turn-helix transcriptional regulator [Chitinophagaceae bacterium]